MNKLIIQKLIDAALIQDEYEGSGKIIASNLGRCYRYQFWHRKNEKQTNPPDARALRIFKAGDLFHKFVQDILIKQGYEAEVKFENNDIKFRADLVNSNEVVDLKSQHSRSFWYLQKKGTDIRKDRYTNWLQIMLGCEYLKKSQGRLVLISKDDLCIAEYVQPYNDFWKFELNGELQYLRYIWEKQELPDAIPRAYNGKECNYCSYKIKCKQYEKDKTDPK
jgi:hypothetical protein